jgi:ubiquinone biosynthesis protein
MEAAAGGKLRDNMASDNGIRVPWIEHSLTSENILVSEWISGLRIDDVEGLIAAGHKIEEITDRAATSFFNQVFRDGYFHADMHPGNIFITSDGTLVPIDFGIMGSLQPEDRFFLGNLLIALLERDYDKVAQLHYDAGMLSETASHALFAQNLRAFVDPIMDKPIGEIELSKALGQILQISARFDIFVQPQFNLLQKTMVMAEGVARSLNPNANIWQLAKPLASDWVQAQTGFTLKLQQILTDIDRIFRILPKILDDYEHSLTEKKPDKSNFGKFMFISNLGWFIAGISISVAIMLF